MARCPPSEITSIFWRNEPRAKLPPPPPSPCTRTLFPTAGNRVCNQFHDPLSPPLHCTRNTPVRMLTPPGQTSRMDKLQVIRTPTLHDLPTETARMRPITATARRPFLHPCAACTPGNRFKGGGVPPSPQHSGPDSTPKAFPYPNTAPTASPTASNRPPTASHPL